MAHVCPGPLDWLVLNQTPSLRAAGSSALTWGSLKTAYLPGGSNRQTWLVGVAGRGACLMPFSGCRQSSGPHPPRMGLQTRAVHHPPPPTLMTSADKDTRSSRGREDPGDGDTPRPPGISAPSSLLRAGRGGGVGVLQCVPLP